MQKYSQLSLNFVKLASAAAVEFVNSKNLYEQAKSNNTLKHKVSNLEEQEHNIESNDYLQSSLHELEQSQEVLPLWIDDTAEDMSNEINHRKSAAYKELHRPALTTNAMGLFGGEPGFEKAHRVWVDPDHPHMKHIFNQTPLASNLRYTRYGYFKREMHLLDVDKLIRHARMLPTPTCLLSDFIYQKVPLNDVKCAAFLRYECEQLSLLSSWERKSEFVNAEEMFERMTVTNLPPVEVGVKTHAEIIRCCAVCGEWRKGFEVYYKRACEIEEEEQMNISASNMNESVDSIHNESNRFILDTNIFDAVLELCIACKRPAEGLKIIEEVIERHLRPRTVMLDKAMILVSLAIEDIDEVKEKNTKQWEKSEEWREESEEMYYEEEESVATPAAYYEENKISESEKNATEDIVPSNELQRSVNSELCTKKLEYLNENIKNSEDAIKICDKQEVADTHINRHRYKCDGFHDKRDYYVTCGLDLWTLYDFYKLPRSIKSIESYMQMTALFQNSPDLVLEALSYAEANKLKLTLTCFYWALYAIRHIPSFGEYVMEVFSQLSQHGLTSDYILFTMGFTYAAVQKDGELALSLYEQHFVSSSIRPTPEIVLLIIQSFAHCASPRVEMLSAASYLIEHLEKISGSIDKVEEIYDEYLLLTAYLGAIQDGFSRLKSLVSLGKCIKTSYLNSLLQANANAENGCCGLSMTVEIMHIFILLKVPFNDDTLRCVALSEEMYGSNDELTEWRCKIEDAISKSVNHSLGCDADLTIDETPPHRVRQMRCEWKLKSRDIILKRYGQRSLAGEKEMRVNVGGINRPFGNDPGEKIVELHIEESKHKYVVHEY